MGEVFIGSEALSAGRLTKHELRRWYKPQFPDVYTPRNADISLRDRITGAWLWSRRRAVVSGIAASALHGAKWVDADTPIELILPKARKHSGLVVRNESLAPGEVTAVSGIPVTTVVRTAFDLGRHLRRDQAVARLDALANANPVSVAKVLCLIRRHRGVRGVASLPGVLALVDGGAQSPKETWLRLLLTDAGFPKPVTQIPVHDAWALIGVLDMGWPEYKVGAEYDGDYHRADRRRYVKDIRRSRALEQLGWCVIRVVAEDRRRDIIERVDEAMRRRGFHRDPR